MSTFLTELQKLGSQWQANVGLHAEPKNCATDQDVNAWWQSFANQRLTGWAQFSDMNILFNDEAPCAKAQPTGPLLAAEFIVGDTSHQLRTTATGWIATKITLESPAPGTHLETRSFLADKEGKHKLTYQVAWKSEKPGAPARPVACRLINIEPA